ncbi:BRO-N domain-containing protein [Iningainema tapete]|uniref:Bro-N domain-containing protein n=1 Tax=Iningainema tapete BLCC-T55 TaxID=2748662 RepID=A0A8J6XJ26_9CYAN|nr:BRO family protein [Iningainema tapete]MBD2771172.1 hypothetical protein [Iningainema tapete BLCC-T55]
MSNLTVFQFESQEVRFVGSADDPWWVASDVCAILGIVVSLAVNGRERKTKDGSVYHDGGLDEDEKGVAIVNTPGGDQEMLVVNEPGLYRLIFKSRKPVARRFQRWVYHEVLPAIRKTGSFAIAEPQKEIQPQEQPQLALPPATPTPQEISDVIDLMLGNTDLHPNLKAGVKGNAIAKLHPQLRTVIEEAKALLPVSIESNLVRPTVLANKLTESTGEKWSAVRVNKVLIEQGFQIKNPDGKNPDYLPTEKGKEHSEIVVDTAKGHGKTIQSLQWHLTVLEALEMNDC